MLNQVGLGNGAFSEFYLLENNLPRISSFRSLNLQKVNTLIFRLSVNGYRISTNRIFLYQLTFQII